MGELGFQAHPNCPNAGEQRGNVKRLCPLAAAQPLPESRRVLSAFYPPDHSATGLKTAVMADPNATHSRAQAELAAVLMNAPKEFGRSAAIDPRTSTDVIPVMTMCLPIRCASLAGTIVAPPRPLKRSPAKASEPC